MPDLRFTVASARADGSSVRFAFTVANAGGEPVESTALRVQISIRAHLRRYSAREARALAGVFGEPAAWERSLGPLAWCEAPAQLGAFANEGVGWVEASLDSGSAAGNYCAALDGGEIPLLFLFRGRVAYLAPEGRRIAPVPWDREASFRLPVATLRADARADTRSAVSAKGLPHGV